MEVSHGIPVQCFFAEPLRVLAGAYGDGIVKEFTNALPSSISITLSRCTGEVLAAKSEEDWDEARAAAEEMVRAVAQSGTQVLDFPLMWH